MPDENFSDNLMRAVLAELHFLNTMTAAREMFGRGYFSLGVPEKLAVDQTVLANVGGNYQAITPEFLTGQQAQQPMGFRGPTS
jgi:hypothetical protein